MDKTEMMEILEEKISTTKNEALKSSLKKKLNALKGNKTVLK